MFPHPITLHYLLPFNMPKVHFNSSLCSTLICAHISSFSICSTYYVDLLSSILFSLYSTLNLCPHPITLHCALSHFQQYNNFKNKNADGMPLIMLMGGCACAVSWLVYGLLLGDPNIYVSDDFGYLCTLCLYSM